MPNLRREVVELLTDDLLKSVNLTQPSVFCGHLFKTEKSINLQLIFFYLPEGIGESQIWCNL